MISFATKLHILLIMIIIGIGLYMFLLFKEVKMFGEDLDQIRQDIMLLKSGGVVAPTPSPVAAAAVCIKDGKDKGPIVIEYNDESDSESVTSNEIKNILTNIHHTDGGDVESDVEDPIEDVAAATIDIAPTAPAAPAATPTATDAAPAAATEPSKVIPNLLLLSKEALENVKYDEIRAYLRKEGHNMQGNKQQLIEKILILAKNKDIVA